MFDRFPPLRPICSEFNSCTSKLSEFVDAFLKPLAQQSTSYIKDTSDFVQKIEIYVAPLVTHSKTFLVTMDVPSLYPNTDHQEGIDACETALNTRTSQSVPTSVLCDLIMTTLKCNTNIWRTFFSSNQRYSNGNPYGRKSSLFIHGKIRDRFTNDYRNKYNKSPGIWLRYIDDIFLTWDHDESSLKHFISFCNSYSTNQNKKSKISFKADYSMSHDYFLDTKKLNSMHTL